MDKVKFQKEAKAFAFELQTLTTDRIMQIQALKPSSEYTKEYLEIQRDFWDKRMLLKKKYGRY